MWAYQAMHQIEDSLLESHLVPLHVKAGDAVILDDALVHYSPPNTTDERRLAIQFVMVPAEADALFFQQVGEHDGTMDVDVWKVDEGFFFDFWHGDGDAAHGEVVERIELPVPRMTPRALWELMPEDQRPPGPPPEDDAVGAAGLTEAVAAEPEPEPVTEPEPEPVAEPVAVGAGPDSPGTATGRDPQAPPRRRRLGFLRGRR
jgi:hypothetical protein